VNHPRPSAPPSGLEIDGLLPVDKPSGMTSHDCVAAVRRRFGLRKVGHGGTLDPLATGLLVLLLGRGTKLSQWVMGSDKEYRGVMHFGIRTDTQDVEGRVLSDQPVENLTAERVAREMRARIGDQMQTPPMVSAVKKNGVPLYKLARKGKTVEREPRLIHVYSFDLDWFASPRAGFSMRCTKGTYVRTLCADIGDAIGCGAHLEELRRTASGALSLEDAVAWDRLIAMDPEELRGAVRGIHQVIQDAGS
jgi:tRNA pseudouridine55 synthase